MPDPAWPSSPPEANYLRLVGSGAAGTATTLASGAAWQALMGSNELAFSVSSLNTAVTALDFEGVGGTSSTAAVTGLNTSLQVLCGWIQEKPPIAVAAVSAYETAVSSMIPAAVSLANRAEQDAAVAINPLVLGALTPAIVALDTAYFGEHWPHNASTGAAYGAALAALVPALAVPPPLAPPGASAAAPATAAAAVAQTTGQAAAGHAMKQTANAARTAGEGSAVPAEAGQLAATMTQPMQAAVGALQPATGMFNAPLQAVQGLSGLPQSLLGGFGGTPGSAAAAEAAAPAGVVAGALGGLAGPAAVGGGAAVGSVGGGSGGAGTGAPLGPGLTSYTRPSSSFTPENAGRPIGLKTGLLSAADARGPTTTGAGAGLPVAPAHPGMLAGGKGEVVKDKVLRSRIVIGANTDPTDRSS